MLCSAILFQIHSRLMGCMFNLFSPCKWNSIEWYANNYACFRLCIQRYRCNCPNLHDMFTLEILPVLFLLSVSCLPGWLKSSFWSAELSLNVLCIYMAKYLNLYSTQNWLIIWLHVNLLSDMQYRFCFCRYNADVLMLVRKCVWLPIETGCLHEHLS